MGHYRATATGRHKRSAWPYTGQNALLAAPGDSGIGQVVEDPLKTKIPQKTLS